MVEIPSARFVVTPCTVHYLIIFEGLHGGDIKCEVCDDTTWYILFREGESCSLLMTGRAHTTRNVEQTALFRATLLLKRECNTWCHRKPRTWYLHHANLQVLSIFVDLQCTRTVVVLWIQQSQCTTGHDLLAWNGGQCDDWSVHWPIMKNGFIGQ